VHDALKERAIDARVPVVVIYRGGRGALSVARTLGRLGVPMYLIVHEGMATPVRSSRYWRRRTTWNFDSTPDASLEFLLGYGRELEDEHGARPILLTLADWVAIFIEQHADMLASQFVFPRGPQPIIRGLANKATMNDLAAANGIPTPATLFPRSRSEATAFADGALYPVVMKAADPSGGYVPGKKIVRDGDELMEKFDADAELGPPNVLLQEYIPGGADSVWMCNAYFTSESRCRAIFTGKKLRQVSTTGEASLAICRPNETVEQQTRSFMQAVGFAGCVGIGWRYDARDGLYKLLDVNPRVSGVFRLFRSTNGLDVVRVCYLDLTGQDVPPPELSDGRKWLLEDDVFAALAALRKGDLSVRQWLTSLRGVQELHWFAGDDPLPLLSWFLGGVRSKTARRRAAQDPRGRVSRAPVP
jgi:predicted ATP-grasp superfamily ATP-dependent carboligase